MRLLAGWGLILPVFLCFHSYGQTTRNHGVFWGRVLLTDRLADHWKWELNLEKRTQNVPGEKSIFGVRYIENVRAWIHRSFPDSLRLSVSPFAYFHTHSFLTDPGDIGQPATPEFRWTVRLDHVHPLRRLYLINRYTLEYRRRDLNNDEVFLPNWRARYMARVERPVAGILPDHKTVLFFIADEVMLQFGKAVRRNPNVFDQNRIIAGASLPVIRNVSASVSYLNIIQQRNSGREFDVAHAAWIILTFDNLFSQLR
jgi:hypothetical protein